MTTGLERISQLVREHPTRKLQTLMHNINVETLEAEHIKQQTGKAAGVDKVTKQTYEENLEENLKDLVRRMKSFSYIPQPVRRTHIPKGEGKTRPLGIPAYEDKLVQGAMAGVLTAIYEPRFSESSYGYRPERSCHDAIKHLNDMLYENTNWVIDADIRGFFDNVNHEWLMKFLEHDIGDKKLSEICTKISKSRSDGERRISGDRSRGPTGGFDFTSTGKCVSALRDRHMVRKENP